MKFATKKECSALLAFLGEESQCNAKFQQNGCPFAQVSWVDGHIVTVRQAGSHLLLRVGVALVPDQGEIVERLLETASMREAEDHCFSVRRVRSLCWRRCRGMFRRGAEGQSLWRSTSGCVGNWMRRWMYHLKTAKIRLQKAFP